MRVSPNRNHRKEYVMIKKLLTITEAAGMLNIKPSGLRALIFRKAIPYIKVGRRVRLDQMALTEWLQAQTQKVGRDA